jgi:hypothetical protein
MATALALLPEKKGGRELAILAELGPPRSSGDLRPSHRTITLALLAVTRSTTPHRSVQSSWPGRMLLLNAAAAREVSFTLSPRLIIFIARFSQPNKLAGRRCLRSHPPAPLVRERSERGLVIRAKLLFVAAKRTTPLQPNILAMRWLMYWATSQIPQHQLTVSPRAIARARAVGQRAGSHARHDRGA